MDNLQYIKESILGKTVTSAEIVDNSKCWKLDFNDGGHLIIDVCSSPHIPVLIWYPFESNVEVRHAEGVASTELLGESIENRQESTPLLYASIPMLLPDEDSMSQPQLLCPPSARLMPWLQLGEGYSWLTERVRALEAESLQGASVSGDFRP